METEKKLERRKLGKQCFLPVLYIGLYIVLCIVLFIVSCTLQKVDSEREQERNAMLKTIEQLAIDKETLKEENENLKDNLQILQDSVQELEDKNNDSTALPTNFVELSVKDVQKDTLILASNRKDNTLSIHGYGDKKRVFERPTILYFPNDSDYSEESEIKLYFKLDLRPVFEEGWKLYGISPSGEEVTVIPDSDNEHYYYLDLKEKGAYIMAVRRAGTTFDYFALIWQ